MGMMACSVWSTNDLCRHRRAPNASAKALKQEVKAAADPPGTSKGMTGKPWHLLEVCRALVHKQPIDALAEPGAYCLGSRQTPHQLILCHPEQHTYS